MTVVGVSSLPAAMTRSGSAATTASTSTCAATTTFGTSATSAG
jgi:hypothetical protein